MAKKKAPKKRPKSIIEDEVRQLMKDSGHTTYRIAKMAGLPLPTVYRFTGRKGRMEFHTLEKLLDGTDLDRQEAGALLGILTDSECPPAMAGALLAALRAKGETPYEILGLAESMRGLARCVSRSVSPRPGKCFKTPRTPPLWSPFRKAAPRSVTRET